MNRDQLSEKHDAFTGFLFYSIGNCQNAFRYLKETNDQLNAAWRSGETSKLNELGQHDRIYKDYLILKIAGLFDKHSDTLSLPNFAAFLEREFSDGKRFAESLEVICSKYEDIIKQITANRHKVVAHAGREGLANLLYTQDLLAMPIPTLLKEIENLLATVSSPIFPVGQKPHHAI
jgi:hypothetical protein